MQKLFKRSLAMVLAIMMVVTMFAGAVAEGTEPAPDGIVALRGFNKARNFTGAPNNPTLDTTNYTEGIGSLAYNVADRNSHDIVFFLNEEGANTDTIDVTEAIDENGKTVLTFDFYVENPAQMTRNRTVFALICGTDAMPATDANVNGKDAWVEINTQAGKNASWTEHFDLGESGIQAGWNHIAIEFDTDANENAMANADQTRRDKFWNPEQVWKFRYLGNYNTGDGGVFRFDDMKMMTPAAYAAIKEDTNAAKGVISQIAVAVAGKKVADLNAAKAAYDALTDAQKALVTNVEQLMAAITATKNVQFRSCDQLGWQNTPRGEFYVNTKTYTEGTGSIIADLDWRGGTGGAKLHWAWLGSIDNRTTDLDTVDISNTIDENGDFYVTFDFWAEPEFVDSAPNHTYPDGTPNGTFEGGLNKATFTLNIVTRGGEQGTSMDQAKEAIQITKPNNGDWSMYGIEKLQPGWNHLALKVNANNLKAGNESYWDPTQLWGVKFHLTDLWCDEKEAHGTAHVGFDDIRFMSVDQYEATFASTNAVKDVIAKISEIENMRDEDGITAAEEAYAALTDAQKAQVTNYDRLGKIKTLVDYPVYTVDGKDPGAGWIMVPAGPQDNTPYITTPTPWTETFTEGTGAGKVQWAAGADIKTMHLSIMGVDKTWDFSEAEYITFDLYVHGWKLGASGDANFGFGTPTDPGTKWMDQNLAWVGAGTVKSWAQNLKEGWNHIVMEIPAAARINGVGNMRLYFENALEGTVAEGDKAFAIIDDIRAVNANGLMIAQEKYAAKDVITAIQAVKDASDNEAVAAVRASYEALTDVQKGYVFNLSQLETIEAAPAVAAEMDAQIEALGTVTYASKADVEAARAAYEALDAYAKVCVTKLAVLEAAEAVIATEQAAADAVVAIIDDLVTPTDMTLTDEAAVKAAEDAYGVLAEETKAAVTNYDILVAARAQIEALKAEASDAALAAAIDAAIEVLAAAADVTVADEGAINAADAMYNEAADSVKEFVKAENVEKLAAVKAALAVQKEDKAAADVVVAQIAALNVQSLDDKAAVEAAVAAYEALNDSAKKYVANKDALDAAVAAIAKIEKDIADAAAFAELVNALPEEITLADKEAVEAVSAAYDALSAEAVALVDADVLAKYRSAKNIIASLQPYDITFRTFDKVRLNDLNVEDILNGVWDAGQKSDIPAQGSQYFWVKTKQETNRMFLYVYGHKQNEFVDENGNNEEGSVNLFVADVEDMYITFDFYVSNAELLKSTNDAGFGIDTKEGGGSSQWGNTLQVKGSVVKEMIKGLKDGWNHVVLPLTWKSISLGQKLTGTAIRLESFRFYINNVELPVDFVAGMDDIHFVNGMGLAAIDAKRAAAKEITYAIRNFSETATADDFYKVYVAYNGLEKEYQDVVLGWDAFIEANAEFKAAADEKLAADKAAADPVIEAIAALDKEITVDDKEAIEKAEAALAALTEDQKVLVNNAYILTAAREAYEAAVQYAADKAAADAVDALINALPETVSDTDVADEEAIKAAREAYDALTDAQKELVTGLEKLTNAEANLLVAKDIAAAAAVEALINALPTPTDVKADDKDAIEAAKAAYEALTATQKALLSASAAEKLAACDAALAEVLKVKMGDLNGDGKVDAKDALIVLKISVKKVTPTDVEKTAADVNEDQKIDAKDALEILKYSVKKASALDKFYKEA